MTQGEWICPKCGEEFYHPEEIVNICTFGVRGHECSGQLPESETLGGLRQSLAERDALREELRAMTAERDELEVEIKRAWDNCSTYIKERDEAIDCRDKAEYELRSMFEGAGLAERKLIEWKEQKDKYGSCSFCGGEARHLDDE